MEEYLDDIIYLEPTDDITAIGEALSWTRAERVILVVPKRFRTLRNKVNLTLLLRYGVNLGKELALVTVDRGTRELSYEVGLPIFSTLARARRGRWNGKDEIEPLPEYNRGRVERPRRHRPAEVLRTEQPFLLNQIIASVLFAAILFGIAASGLLVLPGANVTLVQNMEPIQRAVEIRADPKATVIDYDARVIPARLLGVEVESSLQVPTLAKKDTPDSRAKGKVVFVNQLNQPVTVPMGTVVATSAGTPIRFSTVEAVTLPGNVGGSVEASVVAMDPGPSGNVKAFLVNTVEGPLSSSVKAVNSQPLGGGSVQQVGVVTQADKDRAKTELMQQLQQKAVANLQEQLGEQEFIPPQSVKLFPLDETYDRFVGEQADALGLKMRIAARGTVIGGHNANALILDQLEKNIDSRRQLLPDGLTFQPGEVMSVADDGTVVFKMRVMGNIGQRISKSEIISAIQGRSVDDALDYLTRTYALSRPAAIEVSPNWFGRVPFFPFRIQVQIKTETA